MNSDNKNLDTETPLILPDEHRRQVPVAWEPLEDAFENNAPEVHSYLNLKTGEVLRVVDGVADPSMHSRISVDSTYLRVDPVSSREQYRWMERFIATLEDGEFRTKLAQAIDGKGAFRRFKDVLMNFPNERERWFAFRSERLKQCMDAWLVANHVEVVERPVWDVPEVAPEPVAAVTEDPRERARHTRTAQADVQRRRIREIIETVSSRDLDTALAFLEFLRDRRLALRASRAEESGSRDGAAEDGVLIDGED